MNSLYEPLTQIACSNTETGRGCGFAFAVPDAWLALRQANHKDFYCPSCGLKWSYSGETELEKARRQKEFWRVRSVENRESAKRSERRALAYKGHLTRTKKRVANGVCPCCARTFQNLARHMKTKHPGYADGEER